MSLNTKIFVSLCFGLIQLWKEQTVRSMGSRVQTKNESLELAESMRYVSLSQTKPTHSFIQFCLKGFKHTLKREALMTKSLTCRKPERNAASCGA